MDLIPQRSFGMIARHSASRCSHSVSVLGGEPARLVERCCCCCCCAPWSAATRSRRSCRPRLSTPPSAVVDPNAACSSNRGCQYTSHEYRAELAALGIDVSMSRRGTCWNNAVAESSSRPSRLSWSGASDGARSTSFAAPSSTTSRRPTTVSGYTRRSATRPRGGRARARCRMTICQRS